MTAEPSEKLWGGKDPEQTADKRVTRRTTLEKANQDWRNDQWTTLRGRCWYLHSDSEADYIEHLNVGKVIAEFILGLDVLQAYDMAADLKHCVLHLGEEGMSVSHP